jgi:hypothetical protein
MACFPNLYFSQQRGWKGFLNIEAAPNSARVVALTPRSFPGAIPSHFGSSPGLRSLALAGGALCQRPQYWPLVPKSREPRTTTGAFHAMIHLCDRPRKGHPFGFFPLSLRLFLCPVTQLQVSLGRPLTTPMPRQCRHQRQSWLGASAEPSSSSQALATQRVTIR